MDDIILEDFIEDQIDSVIKDPVLVSINDIEDIIEEGEFGNGNEPELHSTVSSGNVTYNVYNNTYVSMNEVEDPRDSNLETISYNIINKPLNDYTVLESLTTISIVLFLGVGLYLLIRRSIYRWR